MRGAGAAASALSLPWVWCGGELGTDGVTAADLSNFNPTDAALYTYDAGTRRVSINAEGAYLVFALGAFSRDVALNPPVTDRVRLNVNFLSFGGGSSIGPISYKPDNVGYLADGGTDNGWQCSSAWVANLTAAGAPGEVTLTARNYPNATNIPAATGEGDLFIVQVMSTAAAVLF